MRKETREILLGAVVLLVAVIFVGSAFQASDVKQGGGYQVIASFDNAAGLDPGSEVRMAGMRIGTVLSQELDVESYRARVTMIIDRGVELTSDTSARIIPDGMAGANFVSVEPGGDESLIEDGGSIAYTQGSINFVDLLGRFVMTREAPAESGANGGGLGDGGLGDGGLSGGGLGTGLGGLD